MAKANVLKMTEGNPLRLILRFMLPVLLGQLIQQTYNMVDSVIVGRALGADALAAVGVSGSIQFMIIGFCSGSCDGFAISVAQRFGAGDLSEMRRYIHHIILLTVACAAILTTATTLLSPWIVSVLQTPSNIVEDARVYLLIIFLGLPFTYFYNAQASLLRAVGNSRIPFIFLAVSAGLNIFLDLFCVLVLKWGVAGAAVATITSQALSGLFCFIYIIRKMQILHPQKDEKQFKGRYIKTLILMGFPMGLQFSITAIGSMVMQACNNTLGSTYVTAYTAASRVESIVMCPYVALSSSIATYVGQNFGAGCKDRIKTGVHQGILMAHLYGLLSGLLLAFVGGAASSLFLTDPDPTIVDAAATFCRYVGLTFWLVSSVNVYRPAIQGMGKPNLAIFSGVMEMIARTVFALLTVNALGFMTTCCTHQVAWITAGAYVFLMYHHVYNRILPDFKAENA